MDWKETDITRIKGDDHIGIYTSETKFINLVYKYKEEYPDDVIIDTVNKDGSICANLPYDWFRMPKPKAKRSYTPEQKAAMAERMKKAREEKFHE